MSDKSHRNQRSSDVVSVRARYLALLLDRATTDCFLLCYEIKEVQSKKQYPVVEQRLVGSPAQLVSE
jgi:hypothetical protein